MVAEHFKRDGTNNIFCARQSSKPICSICNNAVLSLKEYNIKQHYVTNHAPAYDKFKDQFRTNKVVRNKEYHVPQWFSSCVPRDIFRCAA